MQVQPQQSNTSSDEMPFKQRPSCTMREACKATGLSRTTLYEHIADGSLKTKTVGRRRLVNVASLLKLVGADESDQTLS